MRENHIFGKVYLEGLCDDDSLTARQLIIKLTYKSWLAHTGV